MATFVQDSDLQKKEDVKACPLCSREFGLTRWKHHCRLCGQVVCDNCSLSKQFVSQNHTSERVCRGCVPKLPARPGTAPHDPEQERRLRAEAAERRQLQSRGGHRLGGAVKPQTASVPPQPPAEAPNQQQQQQQQQPVQPRAPPEGGAAMNPVLAAALRRQASEVPGVSAEKAAMMESDRERMTLVGKIQEQLRRLGQDEPFGLRSMDVAKLKSYSRRLEEQIAAKRAASVNA
eukprot:PhM_4_TR8467/c1_g2_i1/m.47145